MSKVDSANAAVLSAARAYASLKMENEARAAAAAAAAAAATATSALSPQNRGSGGPAASLPPRPTQSPHTSGDSECRRANPTPSKVSNEGRKQVHYSRKTLLKLYESPLCKCPEGMKPLSEWYGEYEPPGPGSPVKPSPGHPNRNHDSYHNSHSSSSPTKDNFPQQHTAPLVGRGNPPARNPFANFGRFGSDDGVVLGRNDGSKGSGGPRRIGDRERDRDVTPQSSRESRENTDSNGRRRLADGFSGNGGRGGDRRDEQDGGNTGKSRRAIDRYVPGDRDNDRDGDRRPRDRERDEFRERDRERDKDRGEGKQRRDQEEPGTWRRGERGNDRNGTGGGRRMEHDSYRPGRDRDYDRDRDRDGRRDRDRDRSGDRGGPPRSARPWERNDVGGKSGIDGTGDDPSPHEPPVWPDYQLGQSAGGFGRRPQRDMWDTGEVGKWDAKGTGGKDAIQAWKEEMKALEAAKKSKTSGEATTLTPALNTETLTTEEEKAPHDALTNEEKKSSKSLTIDPVIQADPSILTVNGAPTSPQKPLATAMGASPSRVNSPFAPEEPPEPTTEASMNTTPCVPPVPISSIISAAPARASRFAKFFDSNKSNGNGTVSHAAGNPSTSDLKPAPNSVASAPPTVGPDNAASKLGVGVLIEPALQRTNSADPDNMARVLSMLHISGHSRLTSVPAPISGTPALAFPPPSHQPQDAIDAPLMLGSIEPAIILPGLNTQAQLQPQSVFDRYSETRPPASLSSLPPASRNISAPMDSISPASTQGQSNGLFGPMNAVRPSQFEPSYYQPAVNGPPPPPAQAVREGSKITFMQQRRTVSPVANSGIQGLPPSVSLPMSMPPINTLSQPLSVPSPSTSRPGSMDMRILQQHAVPPLPNGPFGIAVGRPHYPGSPMPPYPPPAGLGFPLPHHSPDIRLGPGGLLPGMGMAPAQGPGAFGPPPMPGYPGPFFQQPPPMSEGMRPQGYPGAPGLPGVGLAPGQTQMDLMALLNRRQ